MYTLTIERFVGFEPERVTTQFKESGYEEFDIEAQVALMEDMDAYRVTLSRDGVMMRELRFEDRRLARENAL